MAGVIALEAVKILLRHDLVMPVGGPVAPVGEAAP